MMHHFVCWKLLIYNFDCFTYSGQESQEGGLVLQAVLVTALHAVESVACFLVLAVGLGRVQAVVSAAE